MKRIIFVYVMLHCCYLITQEHPKIGLVLSGGGARGLAHVGALKVLEKAGIEPDYITGTSMGAIVGGLYAIGYRSNDIENILTQMDWSKMMRDEMELRNLSLTEKMDYKKYIATFPYKNWKISLPNGLVAGQNITNLLAELTLSVHHINDFDHFPIPFRCIATDIETGEAVILRSGSLSEAMRASMSIPSMFTPTRIQNHLVIDGGVVRNFPVQDVLEMGADIVIAIDVSSEKYTAEELTSFIAVMQQAFNFSGIQNTEYQREMCDILILPDLDGYNMMSFDEAHAIVDIGEVAAQKQLEKLKVIAQQVKSDPKPRSAIKQNHKIFLKKIKIHGLDKVSRNLVYNKTNLKKKTWIQIEEIHQAVARIHGTQYFERVWYDLDAIENGSVLNIYLREKNNDAFRFGFHYDSHYKSNILLNLTFRNKFLEGSKVKFDFILGESPKFEITDLLQVGWKPGFGLQFQLTSQRFKVPVQVPDYAVIDYDFKQHSAAFEIKTTFSNLFEFAAGTRYEYLELDATTIPYDTLADGTVQLQQLYLRTQFNTLDDLYYPKSGLKINSKYKETFFVDENEDNYRTFLFSSFNCFPLSKQISNHFILECGFSQMDEFVPAMKMYLGGFTSLREENLTFYGLPFLSKESKNIIKVAQRIQWNFAPDFYFTGLYNIAFYSDEDIILEPKRVFGSGAIFGYESPIGPFEIHLSYSEKSKLDSFFKIGFNY